MESQQLYINTFQEQEIDEESFYCLNDQEIEKMIPKAGPRTKFKERLRLLKKQNIRNPDTGDSFAQCQQEHEEAVLSVQDCPSTSGTSDRGKRRLDLQDESSKRQSPSVKRRRDLSVGLRSENAMFSSSEKILSDVKSIMSRVSESLPDQGNKELKEFLEKKIRDLETDRKELVGVFGKTGAGKSSLINAIIGEKNLLPSGIGSACTSVIIKVEANMQNMNYEADIEFIAKEDWKEELWTLSNFLGNNAHQENDQECDKDYRDAIKKMSALYGEEWRNKSTDDLMDPKYFKGITEFLDPKRGRKLLKYLTIGKLSSELVKFTRTDRNSKKSFWPLVKCVTVRVPNIPLLHHVTLVDLPGNGDHNKTRDNMWKQVVGCCSTVWIVTEINRAASEAEAWEILENASSHMGNGGECQHIHFICTKSDLVKESEQSAADVCTQTKTDVKEEFDTRPKIKKHFSGKCLEVLTVSSEEFLSQQVKPLDPQINEIHRLLAFLQDLNDCHSETLNYVSGAHGILSLIQGARRREWNGNKTDVSTALEKKMRNGLQKVKEIMKKTYEAFEKCLNKGVEESKSSCEKVLESVLYPEAQDGTKKSGRGFCKILKCAVKNGGTYISKAGTTVRLNMNLASCLTDSIDEEFRKTFPNDRNSGPFKGVISSFSLGTETMMREGKYKDVELQLIFLKTETKLRQNSIKSSGKKRKRSTAV
ncbi:nuclear GTPase SLIP-GC-like isoform X2 [Plectropomus leopardus]|uniref:nuclear GTPase SLIP-GC-like isoform X2 n=1 Tax=Plectropomus leopardus TaxID=160734 RepID=UPI001C4D3A63|nr:nuclear GTPase SLIP-GC-like isoform X2 [Plectropomus leopardus]